jgi:hypothetical protein
VDRGNEPAFPTECRDDEGQLMRRQGMTLRDYFAAKAMQALAHDILIEQHWEDVLKKNGLAVEEFPAFLAHLSYVTADAMLRESAKK